MRSVFTSRRCCLRIRSQSSGFTMSSTWMSRVGSKNFLKPYGARSLAVAAPANNRPDSMRADKRVM